MHANLFDFAFFFRLVEMGSLLFSYFHVYNVDLSTQKGQSEESR